MSLDNEITTALLSCCDKNDKVLVIHSSLPHLRPPLGVSKWDFLKALRALEKTGLTIALPTFTFSFCGGSAFHHQTSTPETGVLGQWAQTLNDALRTSHPIYSFTVLGPLAERIASCVNSTTFGNESSFTMFEALNARIAMLGCDWRYCTQFHRYEEEAHVPYRYFKQFSGTADYGNGPHKVKARMFVRDLALDADNDFSPVVKRMRENGAIRKSTLWEGTLETAKCEAIARTCRAILQENPYGLVRHPAVIAYRHICKENKKQQKPLRIALLGNSNLSLINKALTTCLEQLIPDQRIEIYTPPFAQLTQQVIAGNSELNQFDATFTFFVDRLEDLLGAATLDCADHKKLRELVSHYIDLIENYRRYNNGWIFVNSFMSPLDTVLSMAQGHHEGIKTLVTALDNLLRSRLCHDGLARIYEMTNTAGHDTSGSVVDFRLWHLGRFPFSDSFSMALAKDFARLIIATTGRSTRLIVLDLDNTLWGGILGEDDADHLQMAGDYPGNAYQTFQKALLSLNEHGIALAVCSKNDESQALKLLKNHPLMILRPDHLAAWRINWQPKWLNIQSICEELGLGISNVLFVDDNPAERELVSLKLPEVKILNLPEDPALFVTALLDSPWISSTAQSPEDRQRSKQYHMRRKMLEHKKSYADVEAYYASLAPHVYLNPLSANNQARAVQLNMKTSQFNTTTPRYSEGELTAIHNNGGVVIVIGLEDRFTEFENIGLLILRRIASKPGTIYVDNYLLSCRVLGRGLEIGLLLWLIEKANQNGVARLSGKIFKTQRNTPVINIFRDTGFRETGVAGEWVLTLPGDGHSLPSWLKVTDHIAWHEHREDHFDKV